MKSIFFAIFIISVQALNTTAIAQNQALDVNSKLNLELADIKRERLSIESKFKSEEASCYQNFAVSSCLQKVKTEKVQALSGLKRREIEVNEQIRLLKAEAVEKKAREKSKQLAEKEITQTQAVSSRATQNLSNKKSATEKSSPTESDRITSVSKDKLAEQRAIDARQRVADLNKKQAVSQKKAQSRASKFAQASGKEVQYNKKLIEARERKAAVEKAAAEKTKPKSASLPIPTAAQLKP